MTNGNRINRRQFITRTAGTALGAVGFPYIIPSSVLGQAGGVAPSNRITMGCIGVGGMGTVDLQNFLRQPDIQVIAICDTDKGSRNYENDWHRGLGPAVNLVKEHYAGQTTAGSYQGCDGYGDFRELLGRQDIDTVMVATPDHWHALITVAAARSGKDVYCQKPLSYSIVEGRAMADAITRYGRVFQCGSQRRSSEACRMSCNLVRNGRIGKLHTVYVGLPGGHHNPNYKDPPTPMPVPEGLDYDMWLGPAPWAPYTRKRCHWTFRWIYDYSGGQVTDWGAHFIDMAHWGMGMDYSGPEEVEGKAVYPRGNPLWNTATEFGFECRYANGLRMIISNKTSEVRFEGTDGTIRLANREDMEKFEPIRPDEKRLYESKSIHRNFVDCVKSRRITAAPVEVAHRSISVAHLANIAMRLGRKIKWDPENERILGDEAAARMLHRPMRSPWQL